MAVLIKGMEMPKNCGGCFLRFGQCSRRIYMENRPSDCPLNEVPEPHGDLIDREELQHIIGQFSLNWEYGEGVSDCWDAILNATTVIPASEEAE